MSDFGLTERLLRRDRQLLILLIVTLFVLAGLYTINGVGMRMTALQMTAMSNMRDMPGPRSPGDWHAACPPDRIECGQSVQVDIREIHNLNIGNPVSPDCK